MPEPPDSSAGTTRNAILITRPEPGASETARRVEALGLTPVLCPVLVVRQVTATLPPALRISALLVTSGNAVPALPAAYLSVPLFAVGNATADRARQAGFNHVTSADGDAKALAQHVRDKVDPAAGPLLLACGRHSGNPLASALRQAGYRVSRRVVYAADPVHALATDAFSALHLGVVRAALFFSAETARNFVTLARTPALQTTLHEVDAVAIGPAARVALETLPWRRIRVAARPNQDEMLALL